MNHEHDSVSAHIEKSWRQHPIVLDLGSIRVPSLEGYLIQPGQVLERGQFLWTTDVDLSADFPKLSTAMGYKIITPDEGGFVRACIAESARLARLSRAEIDLRDYYFPLDVLRGRRVWPYGGWAPIPDFLGQ